MGLFFLPVLLGWCVSGDAPAQALAPAAPPDLASFGATPDAAQFDRLLEQVERGDLTVSSPQQVRAVIARLDALRPRDDERRALRLRGFRCDYDDLGPPAVGLAFARAGLADARRLGDIGGEVRFGLCEANNIDGTGQTSQSIASVETALALARKHNDPRLLAQALTHRGSLRSLLGQQAAALTDFLEAQRVLTAAGLRKEAEAGLGDIAAAYRRMGDHAKALEYLRQSMAFAERQADPGLLSVALLQTAFLHEDQGRHDEALGVLRRAIEVAAGHGLEYDVAAAHLAMASALVKKGDFSGAETALATARIGFERLGDRSNEAMLQLLEGMVLAGRGDDTQALAHYDRAAREFDADPNLRYQVDLYAARSLSHEALGDYRAAMDDLKLERTGRRRLNDDARTQQSLLLQYQFDTARRDLENARLQAERRSERQKLKAVERAYRWQLAALISTGLLVLLLLGLFLRQLRSTRRINKLALTDALTGVANRRHVEVAAEQAVEQARTLGEPLSVLTFDLDWFKRINDGHGHASGDQVLVRVARACESVLRSKDLLGRMGGEEFIVLLPNTSSDAALLVAERLRDSVHRLDLSDVASELAVTISLGLAMLRPQDDGVHDVIDRADAALYRAKEAGRNRVAVEV
ncbi:tetratricopeptide repeat-containing diguanylate cyclase [Lysobacter solisilvae (ex Woo and Kim 2020)]|uniref:diguanylate cyclase n=1 Tax=Agrilutibacter terrestris TaxID=2865112 RepID=A0A7H0G0N4_9GAMM|nr:tetratricopeptide repeat-containing diguanylate cyclase [Lysobacter terrestris]QNP41850.1 GGDEF domain-containing protein [Lysobacter terrestris]